jgi:hypothetical protein
MGKRKHRDPAERQARARRREARAERSIHQKVVEIAAKEYAARIEHDLRLNPPDEPCPICEGRGSVYPAPYEPGMEGDPCDNCNQGLIAPRQNGKRSLP